MQLLREASKGGGKEMGAAMVTDGAPRSVRGNGEAGESGSGRRGVAARWKWRLLARGSAMGSVAGGPS